MKQALASTLIVTGAATLFANGVEATAASTYTVKKGDSLASIARAHQTSKIKRYVRPTHLCWTKIKSNNYCVENGNTSEKSNNDE